MFQRRLANLQHLLEAWQGGREVIIEGDGDIVAQPSSGTNEKETLLSGRILADEKATENGDTRKTEVT